MMADVGPRCRRIVSLQELVEGGYFFQVFLRLGIERLHLLEFLRCQLWEMANEVDQLPTVQILSRSPSPQAGMVGEVHQRLFDHVGAQRDGILRVSFLDRDRQVTDLPRY